MTAYPAAGLLSAALWFAARGWRVFPLAPGSKRPAVEAWETAATIDPDSIRATWTTGTSPAGRAGGNPRYNIGIACGPSGLIVIDLDVAKDPGDVPPPPWDAEPGIRDGSDVLATLAERAGQPFPFGTFQVQTASGGIHLYFTQPSTGDDDGGRTGRDVADGNPAPGVGNVASADGSAGLRNTTGRLGWKIDTRGHGGYVVAPGSVVDGHRYTTLHAIRPAPLPGWLADALTRPRDRQCPATSAGTLTGPYNGSHDRSGPRGETRDHNRGDAYAHAALRGELDRVLTARTGERNNTLNTAAYALGQLTAAGLLDPAQVITALTVAATHIGLSETEAARTITSGLDSGAQHPRTGTTTNTGTDRRTDPRRTA